MPVATPADRARTTRRRRQRKPIPRPQPNESLATLCHNVCRGGYAVQLGRVRGGSASRKEGVPGVLGGEQGNGEGDGEEAEF